MKDQELLDDCWVTFDEIGAGVSLVSCWHRRETRPIGTVWGIAFGEGNGSRRRFEVLHSYVHPHYRRRGVRTFINEKIFSEGYRSQIITTHAGSDEGMAFMLASGYKRDENTGILYLREPDVWTSTASQSA